MVELHLASIGAKFLTITEYTEHCISISECTPELNKYEESAIANITGILDYWADRLITGPRLDTEVQEMEENKRAQGL